MKKNILNILFFFLFVLIIVSCNTQSKRSSVKPEQIFGYWKTLVGENEYVQFEKVDSEYVYSAFTYDRLSTSAIWDLEGNNLTITFDDGSYITHPVSFRGDTMLFNDGDEKYVRAILSSDGRTPLKEIGDIEVLEAIIKNVNVVFSEPEPFKENWATPTINWQKISTEVVLKSDVLSDMVDIGNQISKYLVSQGFDIDSTRATETISSYKKENLIVMIRLRSSNEPTAGETCFIDVISGLDKK
jgi:hypothetical protein